MSIFSNEPRVRGNGDLIYPINTNYNNSTVKFGVS